MARADLVKKLFIGFQSRDDETFVKAAKNIISEERKKHHIVVANELERILNHGNGNGNRWKWEYFGSIPMDIERKTGLLEIHEPDRYLEDLVLDKRTLKAIESIMREFREWKVLESNGLTPSNKMLFCGPTGCGKTATAEAISRSLNLPLIYVRFDSVVSSLLGETAANIRKVFDYARRGQWVLFFDEFDAIGRSRDDVTEHSEIKRVVNSFLQIMDQFDGHSLIIAATNFEQVLDPALWRRFDEVIRFDKPDKRQMERLVKKLLKSFNITKAQIDFIIEDLKKPSFADVERLCVDIKKNCVLNGSIKIREEYIQTARERYHYRKDVLNKAYSSENPSIDRG